MTRRERKRLVRIIVSAVLLLAVTVAEKVIPFLPPVGLLCLYLVPYLIIGHDVLSDAVKRLIHGFSLDESLLMTVATLGALIIGLFPNAEPEYREAVFVMIFYQTGELFQSIAVGKSRKSIAALMDIKPETAEVLRDGKEITVSADEVSVGETVTVRPGEKIPLDGVVTKGVSSVNTVALTGESLPRDIAAGDEVYAGCINISSVIYVKVTKPSDQTEAAKILELVESSGERKSQSENFITKFARYYTPAVVLSALPVAFIPPLFYESYLAALPVWIVRALSFLVISCPCALVISVPLSFFGGIGAASKKGILIKGSNYLEALAKVDTVVFDKTGTLTRGSFEVTGIYPVSVTEDELLRLAAGAEYHSSHPIARSIAAACGGADASFVSSVTEQAGYGVSATVGEDRVLAGSISFLQNNGISVTEEIYDGTAVYVAKNGKYAGFIVVSDTVRPTSKECIESLRKCGVKKTVMLSGDREKTAKAVATSLSLDEYKAELLPEGKVAAVEGYIERGEKTVFVGDGINDAPVIMRADVGIAMGALGSDAAIEAADIVLMDDDPVKLVGAIKISRKTLKIVRENVFLALFVKAAVLLLSAVGVASMWLAVFADVGVAVIAILNAMRTLNMK